MPNWTPGPWTYAPTPGYSYVVEIEKQNQIFLCASAVPPGREQEIKANMQLAAKAPELYDALHALWEEIATYNQIGYEGSELLERMSHARVMLAEARKEQI